MRTPLTTSLTPFASSPLRRTGLFSTSSAACSVRRSAERAVGRERASAPPPRHPLASRARSLAGTGSRPTATTTTAAASSSSSSRRASSTMSASQASPPRVVSTRPMPTDVLTELYRTSKIHLVQWPHEDSHPPREWTLRQLRGGADAGGVGTHAAVVMLNDRVDREFLDAAGESLRSISTMSVGYDHIDRDECKRRGIRVGYTPSVLSAAVADLMVALTLGVTREWPRALRVVREGRWAQTPWSPLGFCGPSLKGKTVGLLGFGDIAQTIALRLLPFSPAQILYTTSSPRPFPANGAELNGPTAAPSSQSNYFSVLSQGRFGRLRDAYADAEGVRTEVRNEPDFGKCAESADVLILMANLNAATHHVVNAELLARMKPTAYLVNGARGPLVDTEALVDALRRGAIAGAALDVLEGEPNISADHPLLADEVVRDRTLLLPHIGSANLETRREMARVTAVNALAPLGLAERMEYEVRL